MGPMNEWSRLAVKYAFFAYYSLLLLEKQALMFFLRRMAFLDHFLFLHS